MCPRRIGTYGRFLYARGVTFFLGLDCALWAAQRSSPIWLKIDAQRFAQAAANLRRQAESALGCTAVSERNQSVALPVPVAHSVERHEIVEAAVAFCQAGIGLLGEEAPAAGERPVQIASVM